MRVINQHRLLSRVARVGSWRKSVAAKRLPVRGKSARECLVDARSFLFRVVIPLALTAPRLPEAGSHFDPRVKDRSGRMLSTRYELAGSAITG